MKDITTLSDQELQEFFLSFDYVLSDVDGVLWNITSTIPNSQEAINTLKQIGKKVILVSNNSIKSIDFFHHEITQAGFEIDEDAIVTPLPVIVSYLKKQDLKNKDVFVVGMMPLKQLLKNEGFRVADNGTERLQESLKAFMENAMTDDGSVGAVVLDVDINVNYATLQKVITLLKRPDVIFVKGAADTQARFEDDAAFLGPGFLTELVENVAKRKGVHMAKPSPFLNEYIVEKYKIRDASRVLVIGDSVPSDMGFAAECNYKMLLVLSGVTKKSALAEWDFPDECKPDYYADSLGSLYECILRVYDLKLC